MKTRRFLDRNWFVVSYIVQVITYADHLQIEFSDERYG